MRELARSFLEDSLPFTEAVQQEQLPTKKAKGS